MCRDARRGHSASHLNPAPHDSADWPLFFHSFSLTLLSPHDVHVSTHFFLKTQTTVPWFYADATASNRPLSEVPEASGRHREQVQSYGLDARYLHLFPPVFSRGFVSVILFRITTKRGLFPRPPPSPAVLVAGPSVRPSFPSRGRKQMQTVPLFPVLSYTAESVAHTLCGLCFSFLFTSEVWVTDS